MSEFQKEPPIFFSDEQVRQAASFIRENEAKFAEEPGKLKSEFEVFASEIGVFGREEARLLWDTAKEFIQQIAQPVQEISDLLLLEAVISRQRNEGKE